jgi:hypothetical protein
VLIALRVAKRAGFDERQVADMLWGSAARIADGKGSPELTDPPRTGESFAQPIAFARIHQYLSMATPLLWTRQADTVGVLGLALNTCLERDGYPEEREQIRELLETARDLWRVMPEAGDDERRQVTRAAFRMLYLADILAVTAGA